MGETQPQTLHFSSGRAVRKHSELDGKELEILSKTPNTLKETYAKHQLAFRHSQIRVKGKRKALKAIGTAANVDNVRVRIIFA